MRIKIITVGRKSNTEITKLCDDYSDRLSSSHKVEWQFINGASGKMTIAEQRSRESQKFLESISVGDYLVLLDENGAQMKNQTVAELMTQWGALPKNIVFVVGGAYGVADKLTKRADLVWSLSNLVFPHEIVRLILVEQLYRAQSINDGLPYHHE